MRTILTTMLTALALLTGACAAPSTEPTLYVVTYTGFHPAKATRCVTWDGTTRAHTVSCAKRQPTDVTVVNMDVVKPSRKGQGIAYVCRVKYPEAARAVTTQCPDLTRLGL